MDENIHKDIIWSKCLSFFEGVCFFMAGLCAVLSGSILGYISGALLIVVACINLFPVFVGGDSYWIGLGTSLVEDEDVVEYGERLEEMKQHENEDL